MELKGIIRGLSNEVYHADRTHYSSSVLKTALHSGKEFHKVYVLGEEPTKKLPEAALLLGSFVHTQILEPELLWDEFAVYEGATRHGKAWEHFKTNNDDKQIITKSQYDKAMQMYSAYLNSEVEIEEDKIVPTSELYSDGVAEESLFLELEGMPIKVRADYRKGNVIRDIKTTSAIANDVDEAASIIFGLGYDLSAALYVDAFSKHLGQKMEFQWTFISKNDGGVNTYQASEETLKKGREKYLTAINKIKTWKSTGVYYKKGLREV